MRIETKAPHRAEGPRPGALIVVFIIAMVLLANILPPSTGIGGWTMMAEALRWVAVLQSWVGVTVDSVTVDQRIFRDIRGRRGALGCALGPNAGRLPRRALCLSPQLLVHPGCMRTLAAAAAAVGCPYIYNMPGVKWLCTWYHVPGGLISGPRACQDRFRGLRSHRVHMLAGTFSCIKGIDLRKARER